ncbi:MAG: hypothetical protein ABI696_13135 [Rubrivivax sp.]
MNPTPPASLAEPLNPPRRRRLWPILLVVAALVGLALLGALLALWTSVEHWQGLPLHISVDGQELVSGLDWSMLDPGEQLGVAAAVLLALIVLAVLLPLAILALLTLALLLALVAVGLPLLAALGVTALLLSPVLLLAWGGWRLLRALLRPDPAPRATTSSSTVRA